MDRWAVAYSCSRPVTVSGGPVADICLHYTADLSPGSITALTLYSDPVAAGHSTAYLGLRSGGDALGRFTRDGFGWMTDRYGNLDTPATTGQCQKSYVQFGCYAKLVKGKATATICVD